MRNAHWVQKYAAICIQLCMRVLICSDASWSHVQSHGEKKEVRNIIASSLEGLAIYIARDTERMCWVHICASNAHWIQFWKESGSILYKVQSACLECNIISECDQDSFFLLKSGVLPCALSVVCFSWQWSDISDAAFCSFEWNPDSTLSWFVHCFFTCVVRTYVTLHHLMSCIGMRVWVLPLLVSAKTRFRWSRINLSN